MSLRPNAPSGSLAVRVVRGARGSGALALGRGDRLQGTLRLAGTGVADGRLRVRLAPNGRGRATGVLDRRPIDLAFRSGAPQPPAGDLGVRDERHHVFAEALELM
jgi:hypothetical protein